MCWSLQWTVKGVYGECCFLVSENSSRCKLLMRGTGDQASIRVVVMYSSLLNQGRLVGVVWEEFETTHGSVKCFGQYIKDKVMRKARRHPLKGPGENTVACRQHLHAYNVYAPSFVHLATLYLWRYEDEVV